MKKMFPRVMSIFISLVLIVLITGCGRSDTSGSGSTNIESVFIGRLAAGLEDKTFIQSLELSLSTLSGNFPNIQNAVIVGNIVYFTSADYIAANSLMLKTRFFSLDISNPDSPVLAELDNYSVPLPPEDTHAGGVYITAMQFDSAGNLWVAESGRYFAFDLPPGFDVDDAEPEEIWEYQRLLESYQTIRKLDSSGAEIMEIDISHLTRAADWIGVAAFSIDDNDNVFIGSGQRMYALNSSGEALFTLETSGFINHGGMIRLPNGSVALLSYAQRSFDMQIIDFENKTWKNAISLPSGTLAVFPGDEENVFFYSDHTFLNVVDYSTNEYLRVFNFSEIGLSPVTLDNLIFTDDGDIMFTIVDQRINSTNEISFETMIMKFSRAEEANQPEVITLTIPSLGSDDIALEAIRYFNRTSTTYRIEFIDYVDMRGAISGIELMAARNQLVLDILAGNAPDIIPLNPNMFEDLVGSGLFEDLYDFIDNDPEINRSDLMEEVFNKVEVDGALYHIFPFFGVATISGNSDILGRNPGWDFTTFRNVIEANPQAAFPHGKFHDFEDYLYTLFSLGDFVNWESGTAHFDRGDFSEILKWVKDNYSEDVLAELDPMYGLRFNTEEHLKAGDQIMIRDTIPSFTHHAALERVFGGNAVYKGYPRVEGNGNFLISSGSVAISSISNNKEGAWEFVRMFLTENWQQQNVNTFSNFYKFPTNRAVFEKALIESMSADGLETIYFSHFDSEIEVEPLTQRDVDKVLALIESAVPHQFVHSAALYDIILESVHDYMNDRTNLEETVRVIQNRASIFVSERQR